MSPGFSLLIGVKECRRRGPEVELRLGIEVDQQTKWWWQMADSAWLKTSPSTVDDLFVCKGLFAFRPLTRLAPIRPINIRWRNPRQRRTYSQSSMFVAFLNIRVSFSPGKLERFHVSFYRERWKPSEPPRGPNWNSEAKALSIIRAF